ncbi:MAG: hypothetical protein A4S12_03385 [Proteobacteria bacterium SG_bin5]|nr:methyl-accepting chemotaxis protein [Sphingomonas sp.]OQW44470.1 MAG: hypothetical protein A4S12_03385 [Proteobacteria bacterium SG_bin5]
MTIKRKGQIGGALLIAAVLATGAGMSFGIDQIRVGGPVQRASQLANDLLVEVAPTTLYVAEPFVGVTRLARAPALLGEMRPLLRTQERAFADNAARFAAAPLPPEVKAAVARDVETGRAFWAEVDSAFLPAVARGDRAAIDASYGRVEAAFVAHQRANADVMSTGTALRAELDARGNRVMQATMIAMAIAGLVLIVLLAGAVFYLLRGVLAPIDATARLMERMAGGDHDQAPKGTERGDEIGTMARSIDVFRAAGQAQARHQAAQQLVVRELAAGLEALAAGTLTHRIATPFADDYEALRRGFNQSLAQLSEIMGTVAQSAQSVSSGATQIRAASDDLAQRTEQQAATLEQTSAAMGEVTTMVTATAQGASDVTGAIGTAQAEAREGARAVERAVAAMDELEASARQIAQITNVIDGIAFQTNLLALNAGVEAARAGDAGRGFAVVATEVRALAQRSADAAKDIKALIAASTEQVGTGVSRVRESGAILARIVEQVTMVRDMVGAIATSAEQQASNLQQVSAAVTGMDRVTQQNAAMVEQATAAARSLSGEAEELQALVSRFTLTTAGARAPVEPRVRPARRAPQLAAAGGRRVAALDDDDWTAF